jgi:hypothetical protein
MADVEYLSARQKAGSFKKGGVIMRSGILVSLIVVVLCACAIGAERPAPFPRGDILIAAEDPNGAVPPVEADLNKTWDPAEHLVADWESIAVSMTSRLYNGALKPDAKVEGPQWSLSLATIVDLVDSTGLIGWTTTPTSVLAFDELGRMIVGSTLDNPMMRWYQQPRSSSALPGFPGDMFRNRFSLNLPVNPHATYPDLLGRVEWTMNVLLAEEIKTVDIPFEPNEAWIELAPGMEIMVEQATVEAGKYQYSIKTRYDRTKADYLMSGSVHLWRDQQLPAAAVLKMDVLNAEGKSIRDLGGGAFSGGSSASGSNNQMTGTARGSGNCQACGTAATIRYTLAFGMYEQGIRLAVENIPVPEF